MKRTTCPGTYYDKDTNTCFTNFKQFKLSFHGRKEGMTNNKDDSLSVKIGSISKAESAILKDFIDINSGINGDLLLVEITVINPEVLKKEEPTLFGDFSKEDNKESADNTGSAKEQEELGMELEILENEK